jgi:uncharacterized protein (TIGR02246 family)
MHYIADWVFSRYRQANCLQPEALLTKGTMQTRSKPILRIACAVVLLALGAALAQSGSQSPASDDAIVKAVLETHAKMTKAANNLDADAFFDYILDSDKCVIVQNGKLFKNRQEAREAVKQGFGNFTRMDRRFDNPQVTVLSPDVALLASEGSVTATLADGRSLEGRFAVSLVFVRRDGQWKVLQGHYSVPART